MPNFDFESWDNRMFAETEKRAANVQKIYNQLIDELSQIVVLANVSGDKLFSFASVPSIKKKAEKLFKNLAKQLLSNIEIGYGYAYDFSDNKNKSLIKYLSKRTGIDTSKLGLNNPRNNSALSSFQRRKDGGFSLSDKIWNYTRQAQTEIEMAIDLGLADGVNAAQLSRSVRSSLKNPDNLFRRIKDKRGNLALSKAAEAYNPGRGVYRSSAKNAMRLTRTETNMAYREADLQRWKSLDFVVGIEVRLSNNPNHCPTCEALAGLYPKDFKFIGWHPQCRCNAIPKMFTDKEFDEWQMKLLNDEPARINSKNLIVDINEDAKSWFEENKKRIKGHASIPYFIRDNPEYFKLIKNEV